MIKNVGNADSIIRIIIGVIIAALGFYYNCWLGLIAIIPFATAIFKFCPLYTIFGIKTCKTDKK
ncbi:MAG: hypothetical protein A2X12_06260 [Bacteroidetes bacterium GWE2_29_8]|nr:MAG: hypothetical protein A2X12_06260 [Bacteroidetes bacterium GWE2_29_8]OFY17171.1 MAG: hypothetical protein A2X02_02770 [Bacteroidetes bacterium GWF2_29_10]